MNNKKNNLTKVFIFLQYVIIFLSIYISFITNYEFIGKPLYERPPSKFVYQYHSVIYEKGER